MLRSVYRHSNQAANKVISTKNIIYSLRCSCFPVLGWGRMRRKDPETHTYICTHARTCTHTLAPGAAADMAAHIKGGMDLRGADGTLRQLASGLSGGA